MAHRERSPSNTERSPNAGTADDGNPPVELVFCNPDLLWKSDFPQPRIGQGAFREAFQAVYKVRFPGTGYNKLRVKLPPVL